MESHRAAILFPYRPQRSAVSLWPWSICTLAAAWLVVAGGVFTEPALVSAEPAGASDDEVPRIAATLIEADVPRRDLSPAERRRALERAREEVKWWHDIVAPTDPDERFEYMQRMLDSLRFFFEHDLGAHLYTAIDQQRVLRNDDAAFAVLAGLVGGYTPTLEARNQALDDVRRALRLDPNFAFARFADGHVRILREQARISRGIRHEPAQVRIALANLERAVVARPLLAEAHRFLALGHLMLAEFDEALAAADKALAMVPEATAMWRVCVAVLREVEPEALIEAIERRLEQHADQLAPAMRLHVYGMLADEHARRERYDEAYRLLVLQALPVAHEHPKKLSASQWRGLYADAAIAASHKDSAEMTLAFAFLDAALAHCREERLRLFPLVRPYRTVLAAVLQGDQAEASEVARFAGRCVSLLVDVLANDAVTERETAQVVEALTWVLRTVQVAPTELELERSELWSLVRWLLLQHERTNDGQYFELGMSCLRGLLPHDPDREFRRYTSEQLAGASRVDLREVQAALIAHGIAAVDATTRQHSTHMLARLLRSTEGDQRNRFVEAARERLNPERLNETVLAQMLAVCEVLRLYPVEALAKPVVAAMQRIHATENKAHCHRFFAAAHAALNAMSPERLDPEWRPQADTSLAEYARLIQRWQAHSVVAER